MTTLYGSPPPLVEDIQLVVEGGSAGSYEQSNDQNEISDEVTAAEEILVDGAKDKDKMSDEMASLVKDIQLVVEGGSAGSYEQSNDQNEISDEVTAAEETWSMVLKLDLWVVTNSQRIRTRSQMKRPL